VITVASAKDVALNSDDQELMKAKISSTFIGNGLQILEQVERHQCDRHE